MTAKCRCGNHSNPIPTPLNVKRTMNIANITVASALTLASFVSVSARDNMDPMVRDLIPYTTNYVKSPHAFTYLDETRYAELSADGRTIDTYDIKTGNRLEIVLDLSHTRETNLEGIVGFRFSDDGSKILVWNTVESVYRRSFTAKYYIYEVRTRILRPVSADFDRVSCPVMSHNGRMVAFVHDNNIYLKKLDFNTQVEVTTDGSAGSIINGATDWTYEEEFQTTSMIAFSPDDNVLCYVKSNESQVPTYTLPLYAGQCDRDDQYALYPGSFSYKYPVAGERNSVVSVHAYEISNRKTKDLTFPDDKIEYIPRIDFGDTAERLLVTTLNRDQNRMEIYSINPRSGVSTSVFVEESKAWILPETYENLKIVKDGFVVMSPRSGWTHLYKYTFAGALSRTITKGDFDVTEYYGSDAAGNHYYQAAAPSATERTVCRIDAKGIVTTLSADKGWTEARFTPGCTYAMTTYSNLTTPPVYSIVNARGKALRTLVSNDDVATGFASAPKKELITVPGNDGLTFNAYLIKPADFDASKKYPVVVYQYSGPGSQTVMNKWAVDWQNYYASQGYVVFCMDGRGTGARGADFMFAVYRNLGHFETIDQIAGANWLASQPWVDANRIGIHGWSYGGYETLMCLSAKNNPFKAGVAVAPVTDWRLYDTVYAERYMLTPQQNFDGYRTSAPLNLVDNFESRLLLMSGTADDNVHPANTYEYAAALQYRGVLFDMMMFPNKNHSIYGCNARAVVYANMLRYFKNNL